jgi:nickel-dependent lactate racemase
MHQGHQILLQVSSPSTSAGALNLLGSNLHMQTVALKWGVQALPFELPPQAEVLTIREPEPVVTPDLFARRLADAMAGRGLDFSRVAVVVGDKTRLCGYPVYLPLLIETLEAMGASRDRLAVFIAYGTHPRHSEQESLAAYGNSYRELDFVHHDSTDDTLFSELGSTRRGTPIRIRRDILEASCVVTFGAVSHHYFAGYGGGRKLIFPGLGERRAIYRNHALYLDPDRGMLSEGCRAGRFDGNPLAEDLAEVEARRPADLAVHGILDSRGRVCDLLPGAGPAHFRAACRAHGGGCEMTAARTYDLVVAGCGGFPKDINFIQAHKSIENAARLVADGKELIVLAHCPDGIGSRTFLPWFGLGGWQAAFDRLAAAYEGNGGTALSMMAKTRRIRISLVTDLDEDVCRTMEVEKITVAQAAVRLRRTSGPAAVIPNASMLVPV